MGHQSNKEAETRGAEGGSPEDSFQVPAERSVDAQTNPAWVVRLGFAEETSSKESRDELRLRVGGKGLNLHRMLDYGLPVPEGFCITTAAFERTVRDAFGGTARCDEGPSPLWSAPLNAALELAIVEAYEALCHEGGEAKVVVRSSSVEEDGVSASFAGQQATVLNVQGKVALLDAVRSVWSSLFDETAHLYRGQLGFPGAPAPSMALIVQRLVDAEVAGVLFTYNPVDGNREEAVICAAYGLGETVVGGEATDTFYLDRRSAQVLRSHLGEKREALRPADGGGLQSHSVAARRRKAPSLGAAHMSDLLSLAKRVERLLGEGQDIEFGISAGRVWLLQARPITNTHPKDPEPLKIFTNANVGEALPGVGTPMTWSLIRAFSQRGFESAFGAMGLEVPKEYSLFSSFQGRIYLNLSEFLSIASQVPLLNSQTLAEMSGAGDVDVFGETSERLNPWRFVRRLPITMPRLVWSQLRVPKTAQVHIKLASQERTALFAQDLSNHSPEELLQALSRVDRLFNEVGEVMLAASSNFLISHALVGLALRWWGREGAMLREGDLFRGLRDVSSAAPGLDLLELARFIKERPRLSAIFDITDPSAPLHAQKGLLECLGDEPQGIVFLRRFEEFQARWGHRASGEAELAVPRWREAPGFLFDVIRAHLKAPKLPNPLDIQAAQVCAREEATREVLKGFKPGLRGVFRGLLTWAQGNARLREALRSEVVAALGMYRHCLLEAGRKMASEGILSELEDVFFLTLDEVRGWLGCDASETTERLRYVVAYRRSERAVFEKTAELPGTFAKRGKRRVLMGALAAQRALGREEQSSTSTSSNKNWKGLPGAPGRVSGPARVLRSLEDGRALRPGEILVSASTDVGWTPLFLVAAGVVSERGGPLSHSCVVAREYGIPAVVNVAGATDEIQNGDLLTIDGNSGEVWISGK